MKKAKDEEGKEEEALSLSSSSTLSYCLHCPWSVAGAITCGDVWLRNGLRGAHTVIIATTTTITILVTSTNGIVDERGTINIFFNLVASPLRPVTGAISTP